MKKRWISMVLTAAMTVTMFGGCSKNNNAEGSKTENGDVVTLTFASLGSEPASQESVLKAVNEKLLADGLNIQINVKQLDDYWNKLALDIAGGTQYDIAWAHASTLSDLVSKKVYQPIGEILDTTGKDLKEATPDYVLKGGTINGQIYAIPRVIPTTGFSNTFDVRKDLMKKYGMDDITTLEQLETYFQSVKEQENGMYPYVGEHILQLFPVMGNYYYFLGDGNYALYIDPEDPEYTVKSFWESEEFKEMCNKKLEWAEKGWLISDVSAIENPDAGFDYGKVAAVDSNVMRVSERVDTLINNVPGAEAYTVYLEPEKRYIFSAGDNMLAVPSTSKHAKEAVEFIQWFKCNQDNYDLWSYGVKGVNYNLKDESVTTENIKTEDIYSPMTWMWNDLNRARFSSNFSIESIQRLKDWDKNSEAFALLGFTLDQSNIKSEASQVLALINEYTKNLGNGKIKYEDVKEEMISKFKAAGIDKIIVEAQKQVDAYVGK